LKILQVIDSLRSGGAEKLITDIILQTKSENIEIEVLLLTDEGNVYDDILNKNNVPITIVPIRNIRSLKNIYHVYKILSTSNYDIVHVHLFPATYWVSIASRFLKVNKPKIVMTEHSTHNKRRKYKAFQIIEKYIYKNFDKIVSISNGTQKELVDWLEISNRSDKFLVINNGIVLDKFIYSERLSAQELKDLGINYKYTLCMIGRFTESKDHETVLRALTRLPSDVGLIMVGEGLLELKIREKTKDLGLDNRVRFLGFRSDVNRIIKSIDIIVHSANWEGFGLAVVEGMAAGKPVVATNVEGLSEIVKGFGLLFNPSDDLELSVLIKDLINDKTFYDKISTNCFLASKKYDIKKTAELYSDLYKDLLKEIKGNGDSI
jgi:hypothetical protein